MGGCIRGYIITLVNRGSVGVPRSGVKIMAFVIMVSNHGSISHEVRSFGRIPLQCQGEFTSFRSESLQRSCHSLSC